MNEWLAVRHLSITVVTEIVNNVPIVTIVTPTIMEHF